MKKLKISIPNLKISKITIHTQTTQNQQKLQNLSKMAKMKISKEKPETILDKLLAKIIMKKIQKMGITGMQMFYNFRQEAQTKRDHEHRDYRPHNKGLKEYIQENEWISKHKSW